MLSYLNAFSDRILLREKLIGNTSFRIIQARVDHFIENFFTILLSNINS